MNKASLQVGFFVPKLSQIVPKSFQNYSKIPLSSSTYRQQCQTNLVRPCHYSLPPMWEEAFVG